MGAAAATATDVERQKATEMPKQSQKGAVDEATIILPALLELELGGGVKGTGQESRGRSGTIAGRRTDEHNFPDFIFRWAERDSWRARAREIALDGLAMYKIN